MSLLNQIHTPHDLKRLSPQELQQLTNELRQFLIASVLESGGHFASGLGVIELTVALHYVFDTPKDSIIWDVGHQAYPHKILTERRDQLKSIRQKDGLKPFPCPKESKYDAFTVGHSSTSISAALGMSIANELLHTQNHAVAVIGDGALTAGMAFEALNHAGAIKADMLVILNDNNMSISPNVGALSNMVTKTLSNPILQSLRSESKRFIEKLPLPHALELAKRTEEQIKNMVASDGGLFESLDFQYFGPVDGHDLPSLIKILQNLKHKRGPKLLHLVTQKGKGYSQAESAPIKFHAVSPTATDAPKVEQPKKSAKTYTQVFSQWICDAALKDHTIVAITPAMREGSGLVEFEQRFPKRFFDVAIAEQHAVTIAAGMAMKGLKPIVAIYSTFLQRGYDQLIHDVALQDLPIVFAIDRAGVVGPDGPTHIGAFDLAYLRIIPNMVIMAPSDENEQYHMLNLALTVPHPTAVRYPRGAGEGVELTETSDIKFGKAKIIRHGEEIVIFAVGTMLHVARETAEQLNATLVDLRFVKPLDAELIIQEAKRHNIIITIEDGVVTGGVGSAIQELLAQNLIFKPFKAFGLPDEFLEHGERHEVLKVVGLHQPQFLEDIIQFKEALKAL